MITTITLQDDGPLEVSGDFEMVDEAGAPFRRRKMCLLCRCGHTRRPPFCDASHAEAGFNSCPRAPAEDANH
ncbi:CDGSH iron-sulfur domain-containing protein [Cupriavidus sp. amp6]|uniref:CDGSH iron-sulfur domain-containing protein n=1 Tax=Cupriavidus sp. amp6 TaxID=388051 RepID=UPI0004165A19|nr:CDGSH iron-sulfur domain-containing protein [Cupriavidus sp. amp6]